MTTDSFAGKRPRILTEENEMELREALKRRMGEIDRGEVELQSGEDALEEVFGDEISPSVPG